MLGLVMIVASPRNDAAAMIIDANISITERKRKNEDPCPIHHQLTNDALRICLEFLGGKSSICVSREHPIDSMKFMLTVCNDKSTRVDHAAESLSQAKLFVKRTIQNSIMHASYSTKQ